MNQDTITKLNEINKTFYEKVSKSFSESRQKPWEGWDLLIPILKTLPQHASILDVGCGNARFAQFVDKHLHNIEDYTGIDGNYDLLQDAKELDTHLPITLRQMDILEHLNQLNPEKFDCIVMFGVIHHIPSFQKRQEILLQLFNLLKPNGVLIISAWQFLTIPSLVQRITNWDTIKAIDTNELEEHDYLLDWQRETSAVRYCHQVEKGELEQLIQPLQYAKADYFQADGKNHQSNLYCIVTKHE